MASTTVSPTSPAIPLPGILKPDTIDFIREQGVICHLPPEVVTSAWLLHAEVKNPGIFSRGNKNLMAAVCLCIAARFAHQLISLDDLARAAFTDKSEINHLAHRLQKVLGLRRLPADLRLLVPQICETLELPSNTRDAASNFATRLQAHLPPSLQGRMPSAVAAAIVCAAGDATHHHVTFTASARAAHIAVSATIAARKILASLQSRGNPPSP